MSNKGLTLVELCIVLAVLAVLAHIAQPPFAKLIQRLQSTQDIYQLQSLLQLGREQAILLSQRIAICPLTSQGQCGNDWNQPLTLFNDPNFNQQHDAGETLLYTFSAARPTTVQRTFNNRAISFNAQGFAGINSGSLSYCHQHHHQTVAVAFIISRAGRIRKSATLANGQAVPCRNNS